MEVEMSFWVEVENSLINEAWCNWCRYQNCDFNIHEGWKDVFCDFIDPVRQCSILNDGDYFYEKLEVTHQIKRRIEVLAGPHWYAYLKANEDRIALAKVSWGKKLHK